MLKAMKVLTQKKYQDHVPCSFAYRIVCIDDRFTKPTVVFIGENAAYEFIKAMLKKYKYCKKVMNKHFNENLIKNNALLLADVFENYIDTCLTFYGLDPYF